MANTLPMDKLLPCLGTLGPTICFAFGPADDQSPMLLALQVTSRLLSRSAGSIDWLDMLT